MDFSVKLSELQQRRGRQKQLSEQIANANIKTRELKRQQRTYEQAQTIIQKVAQKTQEQLQYRISEIVTMALSAVFSEPYIFSVEFIVRRGKTEADLWFTRGGEKVHPLTAAGGGAVDVACFALRVALWAIQHPRPAAVLLLDEPFKHLSTDLQPRAIEMLQTISKELGIQVLVVSHIEDITEGADAVFKTTLKKGVTNII